MRPKCRYYQSLLTEPMSLLGLHMEYGWGVTYRSGNGLKTAVSPKPTPALRRFIKARNLYSQLDRLERVSGISGSMSLFYVAQLVSDSCKWLVSSACLRVSLYNLYSLCALGGGRLQCIPSVSETSWGFWVVAFLGLRSFPAGWTASPPLMALCVLIIIFPPRHMVLSWRKLLGTEQKALTHKPYDLS